MELLNGGWDSNPSLSASESQLYSHLVPLFLQDFSDFPLTYLRNQFSFKLKLNIYFCIFPSLANIFYILSLSFSLSLSLSLSLSHTHTHTHTSLLNFFGCVVCVCVIAYLHRCIRFLSQLPPRRTDNETMFWVT
jgi:hypothetical protein